MGEVSEVDKQLLSDIAKYGLHVIHVLAENEYPRFSYSIGLFKTYQHPELIMIGLKQELSHRLINNMANDIKNGKIYSSDSWSPDILSGFECYFTEVNKPNYNEYVGYAIWYYGGNNFPLLQCVYPTVKGIYPWEETWPKDINNLQPVLGNLNNV